MFEAETQGRRTVEFALVVFRPPGTGARSLLDLNRSVENDRRRRVTIVQRRGINEGLERGARLPQRLRGAVELALVKGEAADDRTHAAGPGVLDHHGAGDFRNLMEDELTVGFCRLDIDHVSRVDDLTHLCNRLAAGLRPFHTVEWQNTDGAFLAHITAGLASRLQSDSRRLIADLQHHG